MHETLNFLNILDNKVKKNHQSTPKVHSIKDKIYQKRIHKFPYAKAIDFSENQYQKFPHWLTEKDGFTEFMYRNYQHKLMSIPKICQKMNRASDQKYFVSLYLQQIPIFNSLPSVVLDIILSSLTTCYFKPGDIIHNQQKLSQFMAVIYIGSVQFRKNKNLIIKHKNEVILSDSFHKRRHQTIICRQQTILLKLNNSVYEEIITKLRRQIQIKERDQISDMLKSTFFTQLHLKDKKARNFYNQCELKFYFKDQVVEEAGSEVKNLSIVFKGEIEQQNHIYIREHNKWPMPNRKWQVRAVYNSYHKSNKMKQFDFFGDEQIITNSKFKSKYIATNWAILYALSTQKFITLLTSQDIKRLKKYRTQHVDFNYAEFEKKVREKVRSESEKKKIISKAINTTYSHKNTFSPKKMSLVSQFQKSMMRNTFVKGKPNFFD